ncbi:MAG: M48 family metallopeptidase [Desulfobulbaceae bacterium]|nr:M48 family metallopeptidase [Desulfobulbaceae bacterium]
MQFIRFFLYLFLLPLLFVLVAGCENTDIDLATEAGLEALNAVTLTDEQVRQISLRAASEMDGKNQVAELSNPYAKRLGELVSAHQEENGISYNYKVYLDPTVNAFAMADGTIRVYSGLMDMLDDGELRFVIGHEMGHVAQKHIKKKLMLAYVGSAVRKGVASQDNVAGDIARSGLGGLIESLVNAQFSQQEEREADDYGLIFLKKKGYQPAKAISALQKLATLGNKHSFLSSHPAPGKRAERLDNIINSPEGAPSEEATSLVDALLALLNSLWEKLSVLLGDLLPKRS